MAKFSKKMEEAIAEAMALAEPQKMSLITGPPNCKCPSCVAYGAESAHASEEIEGMSVRGFWLDEATPKAEKPKNPFAVIADWIRGNTEPREWDVDERIPESTWERTGSEKGRNFVANSAPRAFLINPRTGQQTEIPMQSFELGGWEASDDTTFEEDCDTEELRTLSMESHPSYARKSVSWGDGEIPFEIPTFELNANSFIPRDSLLARVLMGEIASQSESLEKMDSILRDAPVEKPKYELDELVIVDRLEYARLLDIAEAYAEIENIVKE